MDTSFFIEKMFIHVFTQSSQFNCVAGSKLDSTLPGLFFAFSKILLLHSLFHVVNRFISLDFLNSRPNLCIFSQILLAGLKTQNLWFIHSKTAVVKLNGKGRFPTWNNECNSGIFEIVRKKEKRSRVRLNHIYYPRHNLTANSVQVLLLIL